MIEIKNLSKKFGHLTAVDDVSFKVQPGEVLGFLGPNGAGKSTTMKMITGFLAPTSGEVEVCGYSVNEKPIEVKKHIGYLPEGAPCYGEMTPLQFLEFIAQIRQLSGQHKIDRNKEVIQLLHLDKVLNQSIDTL
ncbi:MAG: ABC transporter ATP-binding protein, partial [Gammaproteobacteria bacterium]